VQHIVTTPIHFASQAQLVREALAALEKAVCAAPDDRNSIACNKHTKRQIKKCFTRVVKASEIAHAISEDEVCCQDHVLWFWRPFSLHAFGFVPAMFS